MTQDRFKAVLSYPRANEDRATIIYKLLVKEFETVWVDWETIGFDAEDWEKSAEAAIRDASVFIALATPQYADSEFCQLELEMARLFVPRRIAYVVPDQRYSELGYFHELRTLI